MQVPVNVSSSEAAEEQETKKEVSGYPFGNASSGESGGAGKLPLLLVLVAVLIITVFYFGYYQEKKAHAKHVSPKAKTEESNDQKPKFNR